MRHPWRKSGHEPRTGFTLIEVAVVVSITSLLFALSATTLVALMRVERQCAAEVAQDRAMAHLASHFRADAHAATAADCTNGCEFNLSGGRTVRYAFSSPAVTREIRRGEEIKHRDSFLLGRDATVSFSRSDEHGGRLVILHLSRVGSRPPLPATPMQIAAAVNLHGTSHEQSANRSPTREARP
jgi:prepilin-type N-terminal cleavage/methylation domain-containing protein